MQILYFFLLIFCAVYGAVRLICLLYGFFVDKISGFTPPEKIHAGRQKSAKHKLL